MVKDVGFSAEYVEKITPLERKIYWLYHQEDEKNRKESEPGVQKFDALSENLPDNMGR